jgi:hypothetical protein
MIARGRAVSPAGKPPRGLGLKSPAIARLAWRFGTLTYPAVPPCPSAQGWEEAPCPPHRRSVARVGRDNSRGHNGHSGWFWLPSVNSSRWSVLGGLRAGDRKLANHPMAALGRATNRHTRRAIAGDSRPRTGGGGGGPAGGRGVCWGPRAGGKVSPTGKTPSPGRVCQSQSWQCGGLQRPPRLPILAVIRALKDQRPGFGLEYSL